MTTTRKAEWKQKLARSRMGLRTLLTALTAEQWSAPVFSEGANWTVTTVVSHLVEAERGMSIHIHKIRKGEETVPEGFDLDRWNDGTQKRMGDVPAGDLLARLAETRAKTLDMMDLLNDDEWALTGRHPSRGIITVEQFYETMHGHELVHAKDIRKALGLEGG